MNKVSTRVGLFVLTTVIVVLLPWWLTVVVLIFEVLYIKNYVEVIFFGFLIDLLYSVKYPFPYFGILLSTVFLISVMFIRTRIRT